MRFMMLGVALVAGMPAFVWAATPAAAEAKSAAGPVVQAEGQTITQPCAEAPASVSGNRNNVTFTGICKSLTLRGESNRVSLSLVPEAAIDIEGSGNQVHVVAGRATKLRVAGNHTIISAAAGAAPASDSAKLTGDDQSIELDCTGRPVALDANMSRYRLRGGCQSLTVRGYGNLVDAELAAAAPVRIEGNSSVVTYRLKAAGAPPSVTVLGQDSLVEADSQIGQGAVPLAPPAGITRVVQLMAALQGEVLADGTQVSLPAALFVGAALAETSDGRMSQLAELIGAIHPSGVRVKAVDPADSNMATGRAAAVLASLGSKGQGKLVAQSSTATGTTALVDVIILR